jgi:predicted nuclease of predicted toxin-antitoxin system
MRILLDECVNERMRNHCLGTNANQLRYAGSDGLKNGELLDAAEAAGYDALVTVDRGCRYEQNLAGRKIAVVIFRTKSIALKDLLPHAPEALVALQSIKLEWSMSECNQLDCPVAIVRATFGRSRFGPGPKRPLRGCDRSTRAGENL